jgi:hypothetical protein
MVCNCSMAPVRKEMALEMSGNSPVAPIRERRCDARRQLDRRQGAGRCAGEVLDRRLLEQRLLGSGILQEPVEIRRVGERQNIGDVGEMPGGEVGLWLHERHREALRQR